ncbi:beta-ketoacyl synthase N-terminal-like domain-containing protein [Variovorax boronicumulans]|uniref:thiolase family protein n=1 Tax=Variovorax boronicumulans TaxID=436515 RepID=UPI0030B86AF0
MTVPLYIVGVGSTPTGRFADVALRTMARQAIDLALADAGATADQVGAAFFANVGQSLLQGQHMIGGQVALREAGLDGIPIINVENACASASTAFYLACAHLRAGLCDVALAVGAEKLSHPDKARTFSIFDGAHDAERPEALLRFLAQQAGEDPTQAPSHSNAASSWTSMRPWPARTWRATAPRNGNWPMWPPRTTATPCTTRWPSIASRCRSTRCSQRAPSPGP